MVIDSRETINLLKKEYDREPVYYCKHCLSLKIMGVEGNSNSDFCDDCGSTDIGTCDIEEWENLYKNRYWCNFINIK